MSHISPEIMMISIPTSIITILVLGTPILILIMLLPALLELRKPKDAGPRMIMDNVSEVLAQTVRVLPITNIENEQKFDGALIQTIAKVIEVLPSLDV